jgi:hypothetical protein
MPIRRLLRADGRWQAKALLTHSGQQGNPDRKGWAGKPLMAVIWRTSPQSRFGITFGLDEWHVVRALE